MGQVIVACEPYLRMVTADEGGIKSVFDPSLVAMRGKGDNERPIRFVDPASLEFHRVRKRWIVNSLHEVLALFAMSRLKQRGIPPEEQFLPPTIAWFLKHDPILDHAVKLYIRLQAIRLVIECERTPAPAKEFYGTDEGQVLYDAFVAEGLSTFKRMTEFSDRLGRIFDIETLQKELHKYNEHVIEAMQFVAREWDAIGSCGVLGRPYPEELQELGLLLGVSLGQSVR